MMSTATDNKIVLVKRKTRLEELLVKYNTVSQAEFYINHLGSDFSDYKKEDKQYQDIIFQASEIVSGLGRLQILDREYLPNFCFGKNDIVVVVGQDGLVANTLKYLNNQPLIGVNPDQTRWSGELLPFCVGDLKSILSDVFLGRRKIQTVTMAQAKLSDGQKIYAVNDLFIGRKTHVSARYQLQYGCQLENQSSSGIIVSTGLGATGWLKSVVKGAGEIVAAIKNKQNTTRIEPPTWDSNELYFAVREPFPTSYTQADIVFGKISLTKTLKIISQMPDSGVIFSDGIENDFLEFSSGLEAEITTADKTGHLVV